MSLLFAEDWLPDRLAWEHKTLPARKVQDGHLLSLPTLTIRQTIYWALLAYCTELPTRRDLMNEYR
jgi:hypothetical protein